MLQLASILKTSLNQLQRELESNTVMDLSDLSLELNLDALNDAHISSVTQGLLTLKGQIETLNVYITESNVRLKTPTLLKAECDQLMQVSKCLLGLMSTLGFEAEFDDARSFQDQPYQNEHCVALRQLIVQFESLSPDHDQYCESLETIMMNAALRISLCIDHSGMLDRLGAVHAFCVKNMSTLDIVRGELTELHASINADRCSSKNPRVLPYYVNDSRPPSEYEADIEQAHTDHYQQRLEAIQGFQTELERLSTQLLALQGPETVLGAQTVSDSEAGGASELGTSLSHQLNAVERLVHIEQHRTDILLELSQFNMQVLGKSTQQSGETATLQSDLDSYLQLLNQARADSTQFGLSSLDEDQFYSQYLKPLFDLKRAQLAVFDPDAQDQALANKTPQEALASLRNLERAWGALTIKCEDLLASGNKQYQSDCHLFELSCQHMAQIYLEPVKIKQEMVGVLQSLEQRLLTFSHAVAEGLSDSELMRVYDDWLKGFLIRRVEYQMILQQRPPSLDQVSALEQYQAADARKTLEILKGRMNASDGVDASAAQILKAYAQLYPGNERCISLLTEAHDQLIRDFSPSIEEHNQAIETARATVKKMLSTICADGLVLSDMYRSDEETFKHICFSPDDQRRLIEQILRSGIEGRLGPESQESENTYIDLVKESLIAEHADAIQLDIQHQVQQAQQKVNQFLEVNEDAIFKFFESDASGLIGTEAGSQNEAAEPAVSYDPLKLLNSLSRPCDIHPSDSSQLIASDAVSEEDPAEAVRTAEEVDGAPNAEPAAGVILEDNLYSRLALEPALMQLKSKYDARLQFVSKQLMAYLIHHRDLMSRDFHDVVSSCAAMLKQEIDAVEQVALLPQSDFNSELFRSAEDYKACVNHVSYFYHQFESFEAMQNAHIEYRRDRFRLMSKRSMGFGLLGSLGLAAWRLELAHWLLNGVSVAGFSMASVSLSISIVSLAIPVLLLIRYRLKPYEGFNGTHDFLKQDNMQGSVTSDRCSALMEACGQDTSFSAGVNPRTAACFTRAAGAAVPFSVSRSSADGVGSNSVSMTIGSDGSLYGGF